MKILILYVSDVLGHRQAARAIKKAFQQEYPQVTVREENLFRYGNSFIRCSLNGLYYAIIKLTPWFWNIIWDSKEVYWLTHPLREVLYRLNYHRFYREVIKPFNPDAVICTHSLACAISSAIKKDKKLNYLLVAVPTDFYLNPYWFYRNVDMYFLPQNDLKSNHLRWKVSPDKLYVTGIPILSEFSKPKDRSYLKKKWQIDENLFTILIMGGGEGLGPIEDTVLALAKTSLPIQVLVVTGINRKLKRKLDRISQNLDFSLKVLGYVREIDELMEISNLLITKPGGLTCAEALSKGIPMIILDSITGQEMGNKKLLLEKGLAFSLDSKKEIASFISRCINDGFNRELWRKRVKELARPNSSQEIVHKIMEIVRNKNKL